VTVETEATAGPTSSQPAPHVHQHCPGRAYTTRPESTHLGVFVTHDGGLWAQVAEEPALGIEPGSEDGAHAPLGAGGQTRQGTEGLTMKIISLTILKAIVNVTFTAQDAPYGHRRRRGVCGGEVPRPGPDRPHGIAGRVY
jgi:hypothetical protein